MSHEFALQEGVNMNNSNLSYCGIDVSKDHLDTKCRNNVNRYDNTIKGIDKLAKENKNAHFVVESTGGYERLVVWTLLSRGYKVSVVNPKRVRDFAKGMSILAKTDKLDADVIVKYAETAHPRETQLPSEEYRHFCAVMDRRHQLKKMKVAEGNRLGACYDKAMRRSIIKSLKRLNNEINLLEGEIASLLKSDKEMRRKSQIMTRIIGIADISAANILAYLPEIGTLNRREVAALQGTAPYNRDSGPKSGKRSIYGGREKLRSELYMPTIVAITHNEYLRKYYYHLINDNNRPKKVAQVAVMRKLLILVNSLLKNPELELVS